MLNAEIYCTAKCHQHLLIIKTFICISCLILIVFYVLFDIITRFCAIVWGCLKLDSYWNIRCIVILKAYFSYLLFNKTKMNQTYIIYCSVELDHHGKKKSHFKNLYHTPCTMYMLRNQAQSNKLLILHYKKKKRKKKKHNILNKKNEFPSSQ